MLEKTTFRGVISRWWPVAAAIIAFLVVPYMGIALAFIFAFVRRWDRSVMVTLIATGALGICVLSLFLGVGGSGSSSGG